MDAGDGRSLEVGEVFAQGLRCVRRCWRRGRRFSGTGEQLRQYIEGDGQDSVVEFFFGILKSKAHAALSWNKRLNAVAKADGSAVGGEIVASGVVQFGQRNTGDPHAASGGRFHGLDDNLGGVGNGDAVHVFAERAYQDWFPEALDGSGRLALANQPILKRRSVIFRLVNDKRHQSAGKREFVASGEEFETKKRRGQVQRCWQESRLKHGLPSAGFDESHAIEPADFAFDSDGAVKREQVSARAEEHVLAVVHNFAGAGMFVRGGATAEVRASLKNGHAEAAAGEGTGGRQSGESASDDGYCGRAVRHQTIRCKNPLQRMVSFSRVLRLTLRVNPS